jgi:glycerol-3-phosphate acyltransferase PlsY
METLITALLALGAFALSAVPFSLLIGRIFLDDDIRRYGDGNPGAYNVFRAGGQKSGVLAVLLDVGKGVPFVLLAHAVFDLSGLALVIIAVCAVLGHAFSPFLRGRGGKAVAVTFGVLLALPQHEMLLAMMAFLIIGFLLIEEDSWTVIFGAAGSVTFIAVTQGGSWQTLLMVCLLAVLIIKHFDSLRSFPGLKGRLVRWLQAVVHATFSIL